MYRLLLLSLGVAVSHAAVLPQEHNVFEHFEQLTGSDIREQFLNITHEASSVNSIDLSWIADDPAPIHSIKIKWRKDDSGPITSTKILPGDLEHYEINDLMSNSKYDICFEMIIINEEFIDLTIIDSKRETRLQCVVYSTIPIVRYQDLLVLACVLGYLLAMCLIGFICWSKAKRRYEERLMNDEDEEDDDSLSAKSSGDRSTFAALDRCQPQFTPQIYSARPSDNKDGSFEHNNIPYIDDDRRETKHLL